MQLNIIFRKKFSTQFSVTNTKKRLWSFKNKPLNHNINHSPTTQNLKPIYEEKIQGSIFLAEKAFKKKIELEIGQNYLKLIKLKLLILMMFMILKLLIKY